MFKRFSHFLFGHSYEYRSGCHCNGTGQFLCSYSDDAFCVTWGFSSLVFVCGCGSIKTVRVVGAHGGNITGDAEMEALRKMAGL